MFTNACAGCQKGYNALNTCPDCGASAAPHCLFAIPLDAVAPLLPRAPRADIMDPDIRELYEAWRLVRDIPVWCPLSDDERADFDLYILHVQRELAGLLHRRRTAA